MYMYLHVVHGFSNYCVHMESTRPHQRVFEHDKLSFTVQKQDFIHTASRGSTALELSQILLHHLVRRPHGERQCERIRYPLHRKVLLEQPGLKITHEVVKVLQPSHGEGALPLMLLRVFRSRGRPCNKRCSLTAVLSFSHQLYMHM